MSKIVILGAGESGAGAAVLAKKEGFEVFVSDMSKIKDNYKKLMDDHNIEWEEGHHTEENILDADEVIKSPGIPKEAPMIQKLMAKGTPIISEIEFAGRYTDAKMSCIPGSKEEDSFIFWNDDPIVTKELAKYNLKSHLCPFSEFKEEGCVGFIEDGKYKLNFPSDFEMPQADMSLRGCVLPPVAE